MGVYDFEKMGDNLNIFLCYQALSQFHVEYKKIPLNWSLKDADCFIKIVEAIASPYKLEEKELEGLKDFAKAFCLVAEAELPSIGAYLGGLVSQEVIKAITNKYMPIKQFFTFHFR